MKCQIVIAIIVCVSVSNGIVNADDFPDIHPALMPLFAQTEMFLEIGVFSRCSSRAEMKTADMTKQYSNFLNCLFAECNAMAEKYNFDSPDTFDMETMQTLVESPEYPIYMCEFYQNVHSCLPNFIPYIIQCLNYTNLIAEKSHTAVKHFLDYTCDNNATVLSQVIANERDACLKTTIQFFEQEFKNIVKLDETKLFSTPQSCQIFFAAKKHLSEEIVNCSETMNKIFTDGLNRFWEISGCTE